MKKLIKIITITLSYALGFVSGACGWLIVHDLARSKSEDLENYTIVLVFAAVFSLLSGFMALRKTTSGKLRALIVLLLGAISAFILTNIETLSSAISKSIIGLTVYGLLLVVTWLFYFRAKNTSAGKNIVIVCLLFGIYGSAIFYELQYKLYDRSSRQVERHVDYEEFFHATGKCLPTLQNKDPALLAEHVEKLNKSLAHVNQYLPEVIRDEDLIALVKQHALATQVTVDEVAVKRKDLEFYTGITVLAKLQGSQSGFAAFKNKLMTGKFLIHWTRYAGTDVSQRAAKQDTHYNFIFTTYASRATVLQDKDQPTYTCVLHIKEKPAWPFSDMLARQISAFEKLCRKKWHEKEYTETLLQARQRRVYLLDKLQTFDILRKSIPEQTELGGKLDMPLCPLQE